MSSTRAGHDDQNDDHDDDHEPTRSLSQAKEGQKIIEIVLVPDLKAPGGGGVLLRSSSSLGIGQRGCTTFPPSYKSSRTSRLQSFIH